MISAKVAVLFSKSVFFLSWGQRWGQRWGQTPSYSQEGFKIG